MHYAFYGRSCKAKLKTPYTPSTSESENPGARYLESYPIRYRRGYASF